MEPEILQTCTVSHLIHNPVQFVQIVKNSFKSIFVYTIPAQISYSLGFLNVYTSKGLAYLYFAIMWQYDQTSLTPFNDGSAISE